MKKSNKNLINFLKDYDLTLKVETAEDMLSIQFYSDSTMVTNADYYPNGRLSLDSAYEHDMFFYPNEIDSFDYAQAAYELFKKDPEALESLAKEVVYR